MCCHNTAKENSTRGIEIMNQGSFRPKSMDLKSRRQDAVLVIFQVYEMRFLGGFGRVTLLEK